MEEAPAQICTISGMVAALRNHVELRPKQTTKFSFMDERGIMVPITCDSQLIGLMKRYASDCMFELNCDVLDVEAAATGSPLLFLDRVVAQTQLAPVSKSLLGFACLC